MNFKLLNKLKIICGFDQLLMLKVCLSIYAILYTFRIKINKNIVEKFFGMININLNFVTVSTDSNQLITVTV